jgi:hypothetical protein
MIIELLTKHYLLDLITELQNYSQYVYDHINSVITKRNIKIGK